MPRNARNATFIVSFQCEGKVPLSRMSSDKPPGPGVVSCDLLSDNFGRETAAAGSTSGSSCDARNENCYESKSPMTLTPSSQVLCKTEPSMQTCYWKRTKNLTRV